MVHLSTVSIESVQNIGQETKKNIGPALSGWDPYIAQPVPWVCHWGWGCKFEDLSSRKFGHGFSHGSVTVLVTIQDVSQSRLVTLESGLSPC